MHSNKMVPHDATVTEKTNCSFQMQILLQYTECVHCGSPSGLITATSMALASSYQTRVLVCSSMTQHACFCPGMARKYLLTLLPWIQKWERSNYTAGSSSTVHTIYMSVIVWCRTIQYNDLSNKVYTFSSDDVPREHRKKSTLLLYFAQYMDEHLIHGGDILQHEQRPQDLPPPIFMKKWFRTGKAIVMYLNNGTLQVCPEYGL